MEIEAGRHLSLFDLSDIKFFIGDILGARVDLALGDRLRLAYRSAIEKDLIPVF